MRSPRFDRVRPSVAGAGIWTKESSRGAPPSFTVNHPSRSPRGVFPALVLGLACTMTAAAPRQAACAGPITVSPAVDLEVRDEQPPVQGLPEGAWIARITPQLALAWVGTTSVLEMRALRGFDAHSEFTGPERVTDAAAGRFRIAPGPFSAFTAHGGYFNSRDPLAHTGNAPVSFSESAIATGGSRLDLWRLEGEYMVRSHTYDDADDSDGLSHEWNAAVFPLRRPDTSLLLGGRGREAKVDGAVALSTGALTAGYRRVHYPGLSSTLELGAAATRDQSHGTTSWDFAMVAGASVARGTLHMPFDLNFELVRDVETTGFAEASLSGYRTVVLLRAEQTLGAEGGLFQEPTVARYLTFEVRDTLGGQYMLSLEGSFGHTRSFFEQERWLRTYRGWASLSRRLTPWLVAGLDYSYVDQDAVESEPSWVFQRSRVGVRLTAGAQ